ncbi:4a-hydroxytetrahydrobiopterin dehydratase [Paenibacillus rigui]|uniref:Putative pterin-4-alpha-carbinolamine dehydratase n=1 Tax=Paenibacillus rigui TaxID=554312 RepID=A0A229UIU7_9BACL|nr:4a-hydroxytetrahydrobiopterin dehydratase [Paenibacillus rigui]OXM83205.1 4a-hydroxytetrahydrobiopterin dehydratase [Paenibacillus rigui]
MSRVKLSEDELASRLERVPGWGREEGKWLVRSYRFPSFPEAVAFVDRVASVAEAFNHHPFIVIDYTLVKLRLTTWRAEGLTELDFETARRFDEVAEG